MAALAQNLDDLKAAILARAGGDVPAEDRLLVSAALDIAKGVILDIHRIADALETMARPPAS